MHQVRLIEGTFQPSTHFVELKQTEQVNGLSLKIAVIVGLSVLASAVGAYLGVGTEEIMISMDAVKREKLEFAKLIFGIGEVISGLFSPLFIMFFFSFFFWPLFGRVSFKKIISIQLYPAFLYTVEKLLNVPLFLLLGIGKESSPFGLGVLTQLITDQTYLVNLFSQITIFQVWSACLQVIAFRKMSDKPMSLIVLIVIFTHIIYMLLVTTSVTLIQDLGISL
ncbi:hypothetical protein [Neobacillus kokaensis]|uniref:Yip1 domain-containing protein n=1 Tax=Neobacillus kokaensis TaxID=2759023 RepID=A0ABQ3N9V5_9BACI|nr:hypothetical protein [Neobacillus kokaensis]GHH99595.1 hypothetical protein AM1BK_31380 [Neobacillus kokaensis]